MSFIAIGYCDKSLAIDVGEPDSLSEVIANFLLLGFIVAVEHEFVFIVEAQKGSLARRVIGGTHREIA